MESSLDQKRRELFEIHKARLGADAPLMRKPITVTVAERRNDTVIAAPGGKSKLRMAVIGLVSTALAAMALFFAKEAGWLK